MDEIAAVNPDVLLILTGGEPLLRTDLFDLGAYAADKGFTVVLGTNGFLLKQQQAEAMGNPGFRGRASASTPPTLPATMRSAGCRGRGGERSRPPRCCAPRGSPFPST